MALEDFTGYIETDGGNDLTVAANTITVNQLPTDVETHVQDDKDANHFADFDHLIDGKITAIDTGAMCLAWGVSDGANTHTEMLAANDGIYVRFYKTGALALEIRIYDCENDNSDAYTFLLNTDYWLTIKRVKATTTATVKVYTDAARTVLDDTLTITCNTTDFQYIFVSASREHSPNQGEIDCLIRNLDLQEGVADVSAGIKIWSGAADIELVKDDTSPVKIRTPAATIGVKVVATGHADASAIRYFDGVATKAFKKKV